MKEGKVASKEFLYKCPFCAGHVASKVTTGQVDHRGTCGKQFCVKAGRNRGPSKVRWRARAPEAVCAARKRSPRHGSRRSEGLQGFAGAKRQFRNVIQTEVRPR